MNLADVKALTIPEGAVLRIRKGMDVLWMKHTGLLPAEYQQVEYLKTDGYSWIDTGVLASDHSEGIQYVFRGRFTGYMASANNNYLFGCLNSSKRSGNLSYHTSAVNDKLNVYIGSSANAMWGGGKGEPALNSDFEFTMTAVSTDIGAVSAKLDGVSLGRTGATIANAAMPSANIWLFQCSGVGTASKPFLGMGYAFTMDKPDGTPIRNYVPCYRKADSEPGMYDTVEGKFYANAGTGSFTAGPDV